MFIFGFCKILSYNVEIYVVLGGLDLIFVLATKHGYGMIAICMIRWYFIFHWNITSIGDVFGCKVRLQLYTSLQVTRAQINRIFRELYWNQLQEPNPTYYHRYSICNQHIVLNLLKNNNEFLTLELCCIKLRCYYFITQLRDIATQLWLF